MRRHGFLPGMLALLTAVLVLTACATKKFTRDELKPLETNLSVRLDSDEKNVANLEKNTEELSEHLNAVEKRTDANTSTIARATVDLAKELVRVDEKATEAANSARNAQSTAEKANAAANSALASLDVLVRDRNNYDLVTEKYILFPFNSSNLREDFDIPLNEIAVLLKGNPDAFVVLEGHTDSVGDAAYNVQLGEKRNDVVMRYLIVGQGVPVDKVFKTSFGKDQPLASNDSEEGREKNRSVIVRVYRSRSATAARR